MKKLMLKIKKFLYKLKNFLIFGKWGLIVYYSILKDDKFIINSCIIDNENIIKGLKEYLDKKYANYNLVYFDKEYKY